MLLLKSNFIIPVFILHWNRPEDCLASIHSFLNQKLDIKITIIDNASTPEKLNLLKENLPNEVDIVCLSENKGWGGGFNPFLKSWIESVDSAPYCFVSSHDTLLNENCLCKLIQFMDENPGVGIASPDYYGISNELPKYSPIRGPYSIPVSPQVKKDIKSVDFAHATLSIFRKSCVRQIGLFDERYFAYGDEYEISLRCRKNNWNVAICWDAEIINPGTSTPKPIISYLLARNTLLLAFEYGNWLQAATRMILMIINTTFIVLQPNKKGITFHAISKFKGIRDFVLRRYGNPFLLLK